MVRIGLIGSKGHLANEILSVAKKDFATAVKFTQLLDKKNASGVFSKPETLSSSVDVLLDVSLPNATERYLKKLLDHKISIPYIIGCTGWEKSGIKTIKNYSKKNPTVYAPNFSPVINLLFSLLDHAAPLLKRWKYDVVLHEMHHTRKKDAPSGTALAMLEHLGKSKAQVHSSRAGNITGIHEVQFVGPHDVLTLKHEALDRSIFAQGAIQAALWAANIKKPGFYTMQDVNH
jgi:4-hydroxy-tetrahydrodipicolinate reductase